MKYVIAVALLVASCAVAQAADGCSVRVAGYLNCNRGNTTQTYYSGRHMTSSVRRGNVMRRYDASGRPVGYTVYTNNRTDWRLYDMRGRLINTRARYVASGGQ